MRKKVLLYIAAMLSGFFYLQGLALAVSETDTSKAFIQSSVYISTVETEMNDNLLSSDNLRVSMGTYGPEYHRTGYSPLFNSSGPYVNASYVTTNPQLIVPQWVSALYDFPATHHYLALLETDFDDALTKHSSASTATLPDPVIMMLIGIGLVCFAGYARRRGNEKSGKDGSGF